MPLFPKKGKNNSRKSVSKLSVSLSRKRETAAEKQLILKTEVTPTRLLDQVLFLPDSLFSAFLEHYFAAPPLVILLCNPLLSVARLFVGILSLVCKGFMSCFCIFLRGLFSTSVLMYCCASYCIGYHVPCLKLVYRCWFLHFNAYSEY